MLDAPSPSPSLPPGEATSTLVAQPIVPALRRLEVSADQEPAWKRHLFLALAVAVSAAFLWMMLCFHAPGLGMPGIDENAYLVGARNVAHHGTTGFRPSTPYAFVGPMWVAGKNGWYYPKYPFGVPLLDAIAIWVTGGHDNLTACCVSPVCAALAVLAIFLLTRLLVGSSFLALIASLVLAMNPTLMELGLVPSSHAPDIAFATWGMYALLCWWRAGRTWVGAVAGLLLGYAVTIRYSEGLLVLPLAAAALLSVRWRLRRSWLWAAVPVIAWLVPVLALVIFNRVTAGRWTGYDSTHESTGFTWAEFKGKWDTTIQELNFGGLFFLLPLGVLGMLLMFERLWRAALLLVLWFVPSVLLYMSYYWGQPAQGTGFLRFYLALFPPAIVAGMWLVHAAAAGLHSRRAADPNAPAPRSGSVGIPLGVGLFAALVVAIGVRDAAPGMLRQQTRNLQQAHTAISLRQALARDKQPASRAEPIFFADEGGGMMGGGPGGGSSIMYLQFAADGEWYSADAFTPRGGNRGPMGGRRPGGMAGGGQGGGGPGGFGGGFGGPPDFGGPGGGGPPGIMAGAPGNDQDADAPTVFDPQRRAATQELYANKTEAQLAAEEARLLGDAVDHGRPVYALLQPSSATEFRKRLASEGFECKVLDTWKEPTFAPADDDATVARGRGRGGFGGPGGGMGRGRGDMLGGPGGFGGGPGGFAGGRGMGMGMGNGPNFAGPNARFRGGMGSEPRSLQLLRIERKAVTPTTTG